MNDWDRWMMLWRELDAKPADRAMFERLLERYAEPWRAYHTLQHVRDCVRHLDEARHLSQRPAETELALWFHDVVYDTHRSDNEGLSARWAHQYALDQNLSETVALRVHDLILATKHDAPPLNPDAALLTDIDLVILGQPVAEFDLYEAQIRQEYSWVPEMAFCEGRAEILEGFLQRDSIYRTDHFCDRYERQARLNLERSLASLREKLG
jgi:predicted metal-dependent HD superfamily phosphohydrolase